MQGTDVVFQIWEDWASMWSMEYPVRNQENLWEQNDSGVSYYYSLQNKKDGKRRLREVTLSYRATSYNDCHKIIEYNICLLKNE